VSTPGAVWQRRDVAEGFLEHRRQVLPLLEIQEDLIVRLLARGEREVVRFLDLGSGDGATSELLLDASPRVTGVLVDLSPPMLERAAVRLERFPGRWQALRGDLAGEGWAAALPAGRYDAVVSSFAIHHLAPAEKRGLFADLLELLEPGGMFLNMDIVTVAGPLQGLFEEEMANNHLRAQREQGGGRSDTEIEHEFHAGFDSDDEDQPDSAEQQVSWLADAGFANPEIHFKWGEAAIYGATTPASTGEN
jgi:tRNA (cmo5U34)-methyltransferase